MASDDTCSPKKSWLILVSAFLCIFLGTSYCYIVGVLHVALLKEYQQSFTLTAWLGSIHSAVFCLAGKMKIFYNYVSRSGKVRFQLHIRRNMNFILHKRIENNYLTLRSPHFSAKVFNK